MDSLVFLIKMHNMFTFSVFYFSLKTKSSVALSPLRAPSRSCWCSEYKPGSNEALVLTAPLFTWSVKSDSCYKVPALQRTLYEADALEQQQTMPSHKCDHVHFFLLSLSKNGRSPEPCLH